MKLSGHTNPSLWPYHAHLVRKFRDLQGNPIQGVKIDAWSDNEEGFYDVQQPDIQPSWNNRGVFITGADGKYDFIGLKPVSYPIPVDGPVGKLLGMIGRHPWRPTHMHSMLTHSNYDSVVTQIFVQGDQWLASDAAFGVKESLIVEFSENDDFKVPCYAHYSFVMVPKK